MAKLLGKMLSSEIIAKISSERRKAKTNEVVLLATIDSEGFAHYSLLNFLDIAVASKQRIVFALGKTSSTAQNIDERRNVSLAFWLGKKKGSMIYIKGKAKRFPPRYESTVEGFVVSFFDMHVAKVLEDSSPLAKIVSTLTYQVRMVNREHLNLSKMLEETIAKKV